MGRQNDAPFRYNDYGYTVSGPVYFLKFGERDPEGDCFGRWDKTFFFFSQEFRKIRFIRHFNRYSAEAAMKTGVFPIDICLQRVQFHNLY